MDDSLDTIRRMIATAVPRWQSLVETLPESLLTRPPAPDEWSAVQCLDHLLTVEQRLFFVRLQRLLAGQHLVPLTQDELGGATPVRGPRELLAAFVAQRRESEAVIGRLTPADLERSSHHPEYGQVTIRALLNLWTAHDLQHTMQAERALMQAFIPGTGPFRFEFAEQDVEVHAR